MQILQKTKTHVTHCPSSNLKLASGLARVPEMLGKGINVSLGADGAPCNNGLNMLQEMRMAALIHKPGSGPRSMCAQEVLDMATRNGASALGWAKDIGSLEVGKKADLIALDLNQPENLAPESPDQIVSSIVYSAQPAHVRLTMVDGQVLFKDGKVRGLDRAKLVAAARAAQKQILGKI
jgi:cytosine/adenosine deaminase-related metal-dependent hydrolase